MTLTRSRLATVAVVGFALVAFAQSVVGGSSDPATTAELAAQIQTQAESTKAVLALANGIWVPRIAGLGTGLSLGLVVGGLVAYLTWGDGS